MRAWTAGNPDVYDPLVEAGPIDKMAGGAVFEDCDVAKGAVADGRLSAAWGLGHLPGAVYELDVRDPSVVIGETDSVGARRLAENTPIIKRVWP